MTSPREDEGMAAGEEFLSGLARERLGFERSRLFEGRIAEALAALPGAMPPGSAGPDRRVELLRGLPIDSAPWQAALAHLTVGETRFHRDRPWFDALERSVLAPLVAARIAAGRRSLAIWSAGCATGEEPYTLAMLIDRLLPAGEDWSVRVLATDIRTDHLAAARAGRYGRWALREIDPELLNRYFLHHDRRFEVVPAIRERVEFRLFNLIEPAYPDPARGLAGFDLILCRNTPMYWTAPHQGAAIGRLRRSLVPGGWLAVSPAEAGIAGLEQMERVRTEGGIFFRVRESGMEVQPKPQPRAKPKAQAELRPPVPGWSGSPHPHPYPPRKREGVSARIFPPLDGEGQGGVAARFTPSPAVDPPLPGEILAQARRLADGGQLAEARRACVGLIERDAQDFEATVLLSLICAEQEDLEPALAAARRAIYIAPGAPVGHFLAGTFARRMGRATDAQRFMRATLRALDGPRGPGTPEPLAELSEAEMRRGACAMLGLALTGEGRADGSPAR